MPMSKTGGFYLVRCPKCLNILQEPRGVWVYQCAGCNTILRAKIHSGDTQVASVSTTPSSKSVSPSRSRSRVPAPTPDVRTTSCQGAGTTSRRETDKALKYHGRYACSFTMALDPKVHSIDDASIRASDTVPVMDSVKCFPDVHVSNNLGRKLQYQSSVPQGIPLQHLRNITNNFSDEQILGQGGFGVVYKGVLQNGEMIAVKKFLSSLRPGLQKQFENEVYHLMMLKHPNIVRFVGYCYETRNKCLDYNGKYIFAEMAEKLLCLEYLPNGSLDKYLSNESSGLDWSTRYNIIEGICYGLCHLHEKIAKPIIHLDLKPPNILLDEGMLPKITDFGLSRLFDQQQTICTSSCDGTFGYMAPELLHGGTITPKSDIFSLGVIIMEIITGHRDYPDITRTTSDDFIKLTLEKWRNVLQRSPGCGSLETDCKQIKRCIQAGLICTSPDRTKRPPITKVISMLQGLESNDYDVSNEAAT